MTKTEARDIIWNAANRYTERYISGPSLIALGKGLIMSKPKSEAILNWINTIWGIYYQRKAIIQNFPEETLDSLDPSYIDFSSVGPMPYSIPELMVEGTEALTELRQLIAALKSHLGS